MAEFTETSDGVIHRLYKQAGVLDEKGHAKEAIPPEELSRLSEKVTFHKMCQEAEKICNSFVHIGGEEDDNEKAYEKLLSLLSCYNTEQSLEYGLFSMENNFNGKERYGTGCSIADMLQEKAAFVFDLSGLDAEAKRFANEFINFSLLNMQ